MRSGKSVEICVCTFRREHIVSTLSSIDQLEVPEDLALSVIVVDNDVKPTAKVRVLEVASRMRTPVAYHHAPGRNISVARNACLDLATADWVAFIDDDQEVRPTWLSELIGAALLNEADVVFGPAFARYPDAAPAWITRNDFHSNIPQERDGIVETGHTCNVLIKRSSDAAIGQRFLTSRGRTGGEDTEFFFRLRRLGAKLQIAKTAVVTEVVQRDRLKLSWILRRKISQGWGYTSSMELQTQLRKARVALRSLFAFGLCLLATVGSFYSSRRGSFWLARGSYHLGALLGVFCMPRLENYGGAE